MNIARDIGNLATSLQIAAPELEDNLIATQAEIDEEYKRALSAKTGECEETTWQEKHSKFIKTKGQSAEIWQLQEPHCTNKWVNHIMSRRERQCLAYALQTNPEMTSIDVGQAIGRTTIGDGDVAALLPNSRIYLPSVERLLHGKEGMHLQGYPTTLIDKAPKKYDSKFLADLGGNMFCGTVHMALLIAVLALLPPIAESATGDSDGEASSQSASALHEFASF